MPHYIFVIMFWDYSFAAMQFLLCYLALIWFYLILSFRFWCSFCFLFKLFYFRTVIKLLTKALISNNNFKKAELLCKDFLTFQRSTVSVIPHAGFLSCSPRAANSSWTRFFLEWMGRKCNGLIPQNTWYVHVVKIANQPTLDV